MNPFYTWFLSVWGLVTLTFVVLLIYRSRLTRQETDWIPLTDDAREDKAIKNQSMIEMKTSKLVWPIRALGGLSVLLMVVILAYWIYFGIMGPLPPPS